MVPTGKDRIESVGIAERWLADGFEVFAPPSSVLFQLVDMSRAVSAHDAWRKSEVRLTYTGLIVRAVALALRRLPEVHLMLAGYRRLRPSRIDIGVSVQGATNFAPVVVLRGADERTLAELAEDFQRGVEAARRDEQKALRDLSRFGWLVPWKWLRKLVLRLLYMSTSFRRKLAGTFQVTNLPVDKVVPLEFVTASALACGRIAERPLVVDGAVVARPSMHLALVFDHRALDGARAAGLLLAIKDILESAAELQPPVASERLVVGATRTGA
jgi:pyruvate/2-oxoglutarate dehydrogenase complex dihydrolipoamide acyltransferase (E2) component